MHELKFVIIAQARSGSTLLVEALNCQPHILCHGEVLSRKWIQKLYIKKNFKGLRFLKNYGQHNAVLCGLRYATGNYCITLDDDLQNSPEEIPKFLKKA